MELSNKILKGNCLDLIDNLEDKSIQAIITSPPYWGLRDYGEDEQVGLESDFNEYISKLILLFNKIKRVLKDDGVLYVNLGDTYYGGGNNRGNTKTLSDKQKGNRGAQGQVQMKFDYSLCPRKSLVGIPQRFMIKMIENGWICRNQIIWKKNNAMPTSVKDRYTVDYEVIYMFTKKAKYKFNQMKEPMLSKDLSNPRGSKGCKTLQSGSRGDINCKQEYTRNMRTVWEINTQPLKYAHFATFPEKLAERMLLSCTDEGDIVLDPFIGSGTVAKVAIKHNRKYIGIELNQQYIDIANKRIENII